MHQLLVIAITWLDYRVVAVIGYAAAKTVVAGRYRPDREIHNSILDSL